MSTRGNLSWIGYMLGAVVLALSWSPEASAQTCSQCDHTIDAATTYVDASKLQKAVKPGDTICLKAGKKQFLRLENFKGSASNYLTFLNCGGQVEILNSPRGFGFVVGASQYFKLTGTGTKGVKYGFKVNGTPKGASGLIFGSKSSDFEVEYVEVMRTGFAGIIAKTDPNCSQRDMRSFVMRNIHFHHNYIHDTGGEGFYIGYFAYPTRTVQCDGKDTTLYPHRIENVSIHHNILDKNGWDAIQLGSAPKQASIHHNVVTDYATAKETYQQSGIQLNAGAAADVYNNILIKGSGQGIAVFGYGGNKVYNNLIVKAGADAIYVNDKTAQTTKAYVIANNTIVQPARFGIGLSSSKIKNNLIHNNLVVAPGDYPKSGEKSYIAFITPAANYKVAGNLNVRTVAQAGFVDPSNDDYRLKKGAGAIDKGVSVSGQGITTDLDDKPRAVGPTDVGAYENQGNATCKDGETRACQPDGTQTCQQGKWGPCVPNASQETTPETTNEPTPSEPGQEPPPSPDADASTPDTTPPTDQSRPDPTPSDNAQPTDETTSPPEQRQEQSADTKPADTSGTTDTPSNNDNAAPTSGCGCHSSTPSGPAGLLLFALLLAARRRRARS